MLVNKKMQFLKYSKNLTIDMYLLVRNGIGRMMREAGLDLDKSGSKYTNDIACY